MWDFSKNKYLVLIREFKKAKYEFMTFEDYKEKLTEVNKIIILRHDVDKKPKRAVAIAKVERENSVQGSYYFRIIRKGYPEQAIRKIADQGHEIGYHYEDMNIASGNIDKALMSFARNLETLREMASVKTICMHGSPLSKYDNRDLWQKRSYREFGIIGEPYFDVDFSKVMYLTDTGRRWDGERVSIRDKVRGDGSGVRGQRSEDREQKAEDSRGEEDRRQKTEDRSGEAKKWPRIYSTNDLIKAIKNNQLPDQIMLTIHPQRWTDEWGAWLWELVSQKVKNVVKYFIVRYRRTRVRGDG